MLHKKKPAIEKWPVFFCNIDGFVYLNDTLQYVQTEGRIRYAPL